MTNKKSIVMKARWAYLKGMRKIWEEMKKDYKIYDELLLSLLENPCELDPNPRWENELDKLRERIEKQFDVIIEHEDDTVKVMSL